MSLCLNGRITYELMISGGVVSLIVASILIIVVAESQKLIFEKKVLQNEVDKRASDLEDANASLMQQIEERKIMEDALKKAHDELEDRIRIRTAELQQSEERFREVFQSASDAIWIWGLNETGMPNRLIEVNNRATEMLGYNKEELLKMTPADFVAPEFKPRMAPIVKEIQTKSRATYEMLHIRKDGRRLPVEVSSHTFHLGSEKVTLSMVRDITERKKTEEALRKANELLEMEVEDRTAELLKSEARYRHLFNSGQDYILVHGYRGDSPGTFIEVNDRACDVLGYTREEFLTLTPFDIDSSESTTDAPSIIRQLMETGRALFEQVHVTKNGMDIPVEIHTHIIDLGGDRIALSICRDITKRRKSEEEIKKSLKEKEVLLKEIHHRVKNNMAIISSLLQLQARYSRNETVDRLFRDSQSRIGSMALVHEKLYQTKDFANINFREYVEELVSHLMSTYGKKEGEIGLLLSVGDVNLSIDTMIPCGLILNELVTNSLKYAFEGIESPEIGISFDAHDGLATLVCSDNGMGIPEHVDFPNTETLGLQLVDMLAHQLMGTARLERNPETRFTIKFELAAQK